MSFIGFRRKGNKMNNYPKLSFFINEIKRDSILNDNVEVNLILSSLVDDHTIEPIDDPMVACDFWDWADVVGIIDEFCPNEPFWAEG